MREAELILQADSIRNGLDMLNTLYGKDPQPLRHRLVLVHGPSEVSSAHAQNLVCTQNHPPLSLEDHFFPLKLVPSTRKVGDC